MYAKALVNPFAVQGLPCIPDNIVLPSFKFMTKARGVFSTGTNGVGFVAIDPFQMLCNDGSFVAPQGMGGAIYYTDKTYDNAFGMTISSGGTLVTGVNIANPNSQYSFDDFNENSANPSIRTRQFRLVGCGIRVNYIGSNLYNAGRLIIWRNQGNQSIQANTVYTSALILQDNYSSITTVSRGSKYVYYVPDDPTFIAYNPYNDFSPDLEATGLFPGSNHRSMGILIDGGSLTPNQQSWEFEAVAYFEVIGAGFTLSKSDGDPVGHDIIMSSLPNSAPTSAPQQVEQGVLSQFVKGFSETTREVAYNVGRSALGYAVNTAASYMRSNQNQLYLMPS
jgi:hypothetical protein